MNSLGCGKPLYGRNELFSTRRPLRRISRTRRHDALPPIFFAAFRKLSSGMEAPRRAPGVQGGRGTLVAPSSTSFKMASNEGALAGPSSQPFWSRRIAREVLLPRLARPERGPACSFPSTIRPLGPAPNPASLLGTKLAELLGARESPLHKAFGRRVPSRRASMTRRSLSHRCARELRERGGLPRRASTTSGSGHSNLRSHPPVPPRRQSRSTRSLVTNRRDKTKSDYYNQEDAFKSSCGL